MICVLMLTSCNINQCGPTKEKFLENYEKFVDKVESKNLSADEKAWQNLDRTFDKYLSECYKEFENELTSSERIDFATTTVQYYYTKYGTGISEQIGTDPEEFARNMAEELEDYLHVHEDEIEALVEEFANSINREELEELLELGSEIFQSLTEDLDN